MPRKLNRRRLGSIRGFESDWGSGRKEDQKGTRMKISQKLISGFSAVTMLVGIVGVIALYSQNKTIENSVSNQIACIRRKFSTLEELDTKVLSAALEVFVQDQAFKDIYLEKDREKLYNYGQPLFQKLKNKYGITHFYFILPDGHCFVRLHNKEIYGDLITRFTFQKAKDTKKIASGIELGKTAYALRSVMPYYNNNALIGYVEFGEDIGHFLEILKGDTGNEFALVADKKYLDREDWKSVRQAAGLRDNWDDLEEHVIISDTAKGKRGIGKTARKIFTEKNLRQVEKAEALFFKQIQSNGKIFAGGGFQVIDAGGRHAGAVLSLIEITEQAGIAQKTNSITLGTAISAFIMALSISFFLSRSISKPITKLKNAASEIGKGRLNTRIEIKANDEIGSLAADFNKMAENLNTSMQKERRLAGAALAAANAEKQKALELEKAYRELKEMQDILIQAAKVNAIGRLASGVAHEVRNPLGIIMQNINYLEKKIPSGEQDISETLSMAKNNVKRADKIINSLLDFSRTTKLELQPEDINSVLESSLALVKIEFKNIEIIWETKKGLPEVLADKNRLEQVFINVFLNAAHAMNEAGRLTIRSYDKQFEEIKNGAGKRSGGHFEIGERVVIIEIEDTGIGISEQNLEKIFDPFFTTKGPSGGSGLGLSVSQNIVAMHKGLLEIKSQVGRGTKVVITLKSARGQGNG